MMSTWGYRACIWCGILGFALFGIGIWPIAHFIPPVAPSGSAADVATLYAGHSLRILLGSMIAIFGATMLAPFFGAMTIIFKRIEGDRAPLSTSLALSATLVVSFFVLGLLLLTVTGFRPDRAPELTQLLNDLAWLVIVSPAAPGVVMLGCAGMVVLRDKSAEPLLPRWTGYMSLWLALLLVPGALAILFKTGPFAWDGLLAFWIPFGLFGLWVMVMAQQMLKALGRAGA
jgi:hypothetical protein